MRKRPMKVLTGVLASVSILSGMAAQPVQAKDGIAQDYDGGGTVVIYDESEKVYTISPDLEQLVRNFPVGEDYYLPVMIASRGPQCTSYTYTGLTNGTMYYFVMATNIDGSDTVYIISAVPGTSG